MGPIVSLQAHGLSGHHTLPEVDADFNGFHSDLEPAQDLSTAYPWPGSELLRTHPGLADKVFRVIVMPAFIGEFGTCLWLIVRGLNVANWDERVRMGPVIEGPVA